MRPNNRVSPPPKNRTLPEPVYVDEVFPEDESQQNPWGHKPKTELEEPVLPEPTLSFEDEAEDEDEVLETPIQPAPILTAKPVQPLRSYRVKMTPPVRRLPDNRRITTQKPLPNELPRPTRQDRGLPLQDSRREGGWVPPERTGSWPVNAEPRRNGAPPPKNGHPPQNGRVTPSASLPPKENVTPSERVPQPVQRQAAPPPIPVIPLPPIEPPAPPAPERRTTPRQMDITPPPILPVMPARQTPPQRVFPVENSSPQVTNFRPLVANVSEQAPIEEEELPAAGWEQIDPTRTRTNLHDLLDQLALPPNSLILGVCEDGLPLVLELSDPSTGALLFLGEDIDSLRIHLQAVLASVCTLSDPKQVQIDIITPQPETFTAQKRLPHVQKIHLPDQDEMFDLLGCLFELIEQRQRKDNSLTGKIMKEFMPKQKGPVRILMIDQIDILVDQLAPESLAYLRWLLRRGPAANVWVLASLNAQNAQAVDRKTLKSFGLQVAGKMQNQSNSCLTNISLEKLSNLIPGEQACLKLDEDVIEFSILEI